MIQNCFEVENYNSCKAKLKHCIQYHADILNLAEQLDASFSNTMFAHLTMTSIICASLEKQFIEDDKLCAGLHMLAWIADLFLACVAGQLLFNASESIPHAVWISKWYQTDVRLRKDIQFLLLRSQKNLYITAGPFGILSYPLFVSVMKMSYSVLCLLTS
ncbi:hypothetical protein Zmor_026899 [Zophobas morio]|uniref:Uncharacterized protein n=1 Tax=Zophobas morio TaxID=2755281 RepID=A0AA38M5X3_9CUCU|nr:hypothetical protein Zmor_026899 [Zophobas morio]